MNRTEYERMVDLVAEDVENGQANFQALFPDSTLTPADRRVIAGIALMAVDRYYQHLSARRAERKDLEG